MCHGFRMCDLMPSRGRAREPRELSPAPVVTQLAGRNRRNVTPRRLQPSQCHIAVVRTGQAPAGGFGLPGAPRLAGRLERSFLRRLGSLPVTTRRLLLAAAAEPTGDVALQRRNSAVTEIVKIPNRGHSLTIDHGWREVAQTALDFVKRFRWSVSSDVTHGTRPAWHTVFRHHTRQRTTPPATTSVLKQALTASSADPQVLLTLRLAWAASGGAAAAGSSRPPRACSGAGRGRRLASWQGKARWR